jgi:hypothetical protein
MKTFAALTLLAACVCVLYVVAGHLTASVAVLIAGVQAGRRYL